MIKIATSEPAKGSLQQIAVGDIDPNPDNPRIAFRAGELEELQESIRRYGVQVPIAVFRRGKRYVLIDGERRWRCCAKLNLKHIPALVQPEPGPLDNLLLMFNIHALREQWDLLTIALKLPTISQLIEAETEKRPTEIELAAHTGLARGVVRRCKLLSDLPKKYQEILLDELKKPKNKQTVGEEFFIEMEKALKTISKRFPQIIKSMDSARDILLKKYRAGLIETNIEFRKIGKIARAAAIGGDEKRAQTALAKLLRDNDYAIGSAWVDSVSELYAERDLATRIEGLLGKLRDVAPSELDDDLRDSLLELIERGQAILDEASA